MQPSNAISLQCGTYLRITLGVNGYKGRNHIKHIPSPGLCTSWLPGSEVGDVPNGSSSGHRTVE